MAQPDVYDWVKPLSLAGFTYARLYLGLLRGHAKAALGVHAAIAAQADIARLRDVAVSWI